MSPETFLKNFGHIADAPNGIKKLRELILQLAVSGKLGTHDQKDEPAAKLLEKIKTEKAQLIEDGDIKKQQSLQPIDEKELPFVLPTGWEWERLGTIGETNIGLTYSPNDLSEVGIPVLRSSNIQKGKLDFFDLVRVNCEVKQSAMVHNGDLLICARNGSKALVGKVAIIEDMTEPAAFGAFMAIFRSKLNRYLYYFICSPLFRQMIDEVNTTTINQITQNNLRSTLTPIPPFAEQKRIVAKVDKLMAVCNELEEQQKKRHETRLHLNNSAIDKLLTSQTPKEFTANWQRVCDNFGLFYDHPDTVDKLRQVILQLAVQGKLGTQNPKDEPASELLKKIKSEKEKLINEGKIKKQNPLPPIEADEIPYKVPIGWEWVRFTDIANIASNLVMPEQHPDLPHIAPNNIEKNTGKLLAYQSAKEDDVRSWNHHFYAGQILYSKIRPNLSKAVVVDFEGLCSADMYPIDSFVATIYLLRYILSTTFLGMAVKNDTRVAMPKINQLELSLIRVPVPPLAEQKRIVAKVDQLMALCDELQTQLELAQETSAKLTAAAIAGQIGQPEKDR